MRECLLLPGPNIRDARSDRRKSDLVHWQRKQHAWLQEEDLPPACQYIKFSDHLDMLGVPLFASYVKTRQNNGAQIKSKLADKAGPWATKFMPLTQRPFSINCYLLPKVWYRCHILPLRRGDIDNIKKISKLTKTFLGITWSDHPQKPPKGSYYTT